jgi:hypothetical protein
MQTIDLVKYSGSDVIVLSGRPMGEEICRKLDLDALEKKADTIQVKVPYNIVSLNSSFFLGLFAESVRRLGEANFRSKYTFDCRPAVLKDIEDGISQALNTANPLLAPRT